MPRIVEKLTERPKLKPQADYRETDTYVRPSVPTVGQPAQTNNWMRLGQALKGIQPSINNFLEVQAEESRKEEDAGGQARFEEIKAEFNLNRKKWGDLVAAYPDLQTRDPWYRRGVRLSFLRQKARDYDLYLRDTYAKSDIKDSDDPEAFKEWQRQVRGEWVKANIGQVDDHELVEAFVPGMERAEDTMGKHHAGIRDQALHNMGREALVNEVYKEFEVELRTLEGNDPVAHQERAVRLGGKLKNVLDNFRLHHLNSTEANQLLVKSVAGLAVEHKDKELLNVLDHIETAPGQLLGKTAIAKQLRQDAEDKILDKTWETTQRQWIMEQRAEVTQTAEVQAVVGQQMVQAFLAKEDFNPLQALAALGGKGYSGRVLSGLHNNVISTWKAMKSVADESGYDAELPPHLRYRIYKQEDVSGDIMAALGAGTLDPAKANQLFDDMQTAKSFKVRFEDDIFQQGESYLRRMLEVRDPVTGDDMESKRLAQAAILRFHDDMAAKMKAYQEKNKSPMPLDEMRAEAEKLVVHVGNTDLYHSEAVRNSLDNGRKAGEAARPVPAMTTPADQRLRGTYVRSFSPVQVMEMDRDQVDPGKDRLWATAALFEADVEEWEKNPGTGQTVVEKLALHLGFDDIPDFLRVQVKAWNPSVGYRSPEEMEQAGLAHKQEQRERVEEVKRRNAERREKE